MKFLDEYRDQALAEKVIAEIRRTVTRPWVLMEVCGGQTHSIVKYGLDYLLPDGIKKGAPDHQRDHHAHPRRHFWAV